MLITRLLLLHGAHSSYTSLPCRKIVILIVQKIPPLVSPAPLRASAIVNVTLAMLWLPTPRYATYRSNSHHYLRKPECRTPRWKVEKEKKEKSIFQRYSRLSSGEDVMTGGRL